LKLDKTTYNDLLRALLEQPLTTQDPATTSNHFDEVASNARVNLRLTKALEKLLKAVLEGYQISYLVI
jgi:Arc/MetJ family transcription regulator